MEICALVLDDNIARKLSERVLREVLADLDR
jgi:hypothetical protein